MENRENESKIRLIGFEFNNEEIEKAEEIAKKYLDKIRNYAGCEELKLEMKTHIKQENRHFELKSSLVYNGRIVNSESKGLNPFVLIDGVMKKLLEEVRHREEKLKTKKRI